MPELAFAYACGKNVMGDRTKIFGETSIMWVREQDIGAGGASDLVFAFPDGKKIVVEFKMRDTLYKYLADIRILEKLDSASNARIFCALMDPFTEKRPDDRIDKFESCAAEITKLIPLCIPFPTFETRKTGYKGKISCVIKVWSVGDPPKLPVLYM